MTTVTKNGAQWTYTLSGSDATITSFNNSANLASIVIPGTLDGYNVVAIGNGAIDSDKNGIYNITSISFESPSYVTSIGNDFCAGLSSLTSGSIPSGVTTIGSRFMDDTRITSFTFPNTVTTIGEKCFLRCSISTITIPSSVTSLGDNLGQDSKNTSKQVTISTPILKYGFFVGTDLRSITLTSPSGTITNFANDTFYSLQKIYPGVFYTTTAIRTQLLEKRVISDDNLPLNWTILALSKPSAPTLNTIVASTTGGNAIDFSITAPADKGGADVLSYRITATPSIGSPVTFTAQSLSGVMTGLTDGSTYTFAAVAINDMFTSDSSNSITYTLPVRPNAPINLSTAPPADTAILVSWQDPASTPVSIDYYVVTNTTTNQSHQINYGSYSSGSAYSYNFTGLTNGFTYAFTVVAHNTAGNLDSPAATISDYPAKAPLAPAKPTVAVGNAQIVVTWSAPSNGGSSITGYKVQYTDQSNNTTTVTFDNTATTQTITGLTNATAYTFSVAAFSAKYSTGLNYSPSSDSITPYAPLTAPTSFTATKGNAQVALAWYDPSPANTYLEIDYYTVTNITTGASTNVNFAAGGAQYTHTFTGLTNGTTYSFSVKAHSSTITPAVFGPTATTSAIPSAVPSAPAKPTGVAGNQEVVVSWTAPNAQGSAITGYTVTASNNTSITVSGNTLTATFTGLTNGTAYTFVVYATNANGNSANSAASNALTPVLAPNAPIITSAANKGDQIIISWMNGGGAVTPDGYAVDVSYNGTTFGRVNVSGALTYTYTIPDEAFGGYLFTAKVYAYKGAYASGAFSSAASKEVSDISYGLNFWLDASDIGSFTLDGSNSSSINGKSYPQITNVIDKSTKGNHGTMYSLNRPKPIYIDKSDAATLAAINTAGYATIPTWTQNIGHELPSILFRSANQEYMSAALGARNSPMTFLAVYVNFGANTSFGESGVGNTLIDYGGDYKYFMTNSSGSTATFSSAPNSLGFVIRSGYPNVDNTSYFARINGQNYDTTGTVQGFNTFMINRRDDTPVTYNDILVSEILIYNRALTDTEMAMAEGYLATRWNLLSHLPVGHPYKMGYSGFMRTAPRFYSGNFENFGPRSAVSYLLNNTFDAYGLNKYISTKNPGLVEAYINLRSEIQRQAANLVEKQKTKKVLISAIRTKNGGNSTFTMTADESEDFAQTFDSQDGFVKGNTLVIVPNYTLSGGNYVGSYTLTDSDWGYIVTPGNNFAFDIPVTAGGVSYTITLTYKMSVVIFSYNGTGLTDGDNVYIAGASYGFNTQNFKITGLGSGMWNNGNSGGGGGGGGGGAGDPYITTVSGLSYKLPVMDGAIRFYQGRVDGHMLTVNATLKTIGSNELAAFNMRSLIEFAPTLGKKKAQALLKKLFESEETLCFFEKVYISHNGREMILDVWDQKIRICSHSGVFPMKVVKNGDKALEKTQIYSGYSGTTLELTVGKGTQVHISVFDSPIVRSGLLVNAPSMGKGNGVIVDALSKAEMSLTCLSDTSAVTCSGESSFKVIKESFVDRSGTRVRNMLMSV